MSSSNVFSGYLTIKYSMDLFSSSYLPASSETSTLVNPTQSKTIQPSDFQFCCVFTNNNKTQKQQQTYNFPVFISKKDKTQN